MKSSTQSKSGQAHAYYLSLRDGDKIEKSAACAAEGKYIYRGYAEGECAVVRCDQTTILNSPAAIPVEKTCAS